MRFPSFVILNGAECSEDELLRTLSENLNTYTSATQILRFAQDDMCEAFRNLLCRVILNGVKNLNAYTSATQILRYRSG